MAPVASFAPNGYGLYRVAADRVEVAAQMDDFSQNQELKR